MLLEMVTPPGPGAADQNELPYLARRPGAVHRPKHRADRSGERREQHLRNQRDEMQVDQTGFASSLWLSSTCGTKEMR